MAIKERKQITGTTEQIQAYEGHEGQIVWDKDKKTFVGMSGTAGKNYPLAPQSYVDEGLAGKEDKGVCLPLSGGKLTGSLFMGSNARGIVFDDGNETFIGQSTLHNKGGSALYLRTAVDSRPSEAGSFVLAAGEGAEQVSNHLVGRPNGSLSWRGQAIERIAAQIDGNLVRYSSGLQIFYASTGASPDGRTTTFSAPFSSAPIVVATHSGSDGAVNLVVECSTTAVTIRTNYSLLVGAYVIAIGRWK